ncbi:hypothetical protein HRbin26_00507 [bacterium HR26]|nr:hypothetical protein HRbin26_00507 [bacterium HR26]
MGPLVGWLDVELAEPEGDAGVIERLTLPGPPHLHQRLKEERLAGSMPRLASS